MPTENTSSLKTVLIADDDKNIRLLVINTLEDPERYAFLEAEDGGAALEIIGSKMPDLVILDLMMPRISGLDVLETLKKNPNLPRPLIIVLSGKVNDEEHARKLGAKVFLRKPFSPLELIVIFEQVLGAPTR